MKNLYFNKITISQIYFQIRHFFQNILKKKDNSYNKIYSDGYSFFGKKISNTIISRLKKYTNLDNFDFVNKRFELEASDLKIIYKELDELGVIKFIKTYLGKKLYCYDNSILILGSKKSFEGSWQPHHDSKGRRLKIYIWLSPKSNETHPLYYIKKSHKKILFWDNYKDTRFPKNSEDRFNKIYGDIGDIILFDTHGIHSYFKNTTKTRSVVELTFESSGLFNRFNDNIHSGQKEIERIKAEKIESFLN